MKTKATNKQIKRQLRKKVAVRRATVSQPLTLHRQSPTEFSCGVEFDRACLVEESLDERERRG